MFRHKKSKICIFRLLLRIFITMTVYCHNSVCILIYNNTVGIHAKCSYLIFKLAIARTLLIIACLAASLKQSALIMVACLALTQILIYLISIVVIGKAVGYSWLKQIRDIAPYAVLSVIMWGILLIPDCFLTENYLLLPVKIVIGILFYYGINRILGSAILDEAIRLVLKRKSD